MMFFVTGLPRSRTFWMAQYLSMAGAPCHHEYLAHCTSREQFYNEMEGGAGNSDCGLFLTDFQTRWPHARTLVIERPIEEVAASLERLGMQTDSLPWMKSEISRLKGLRVPYHKINALIRPIHEFLIPHVPFNPALAERMARVNLQSELSSPSPLALGVWVNQEVA